MGTECTSKDVAANGFSRGSIQGRFYVGSQFTGEDVAAEKVQLSTLRESFT